MSHTGRINGASRGEQLLFVQKEVRDILKNPDLNKTTDFVIEDSDISKFIMIIKPVEGLYESLSIPFELSVPQNYPLPGSPIEARCLENIYHPNIFEKGRLCLKYDGIGNLGVGYKETLENLVVAINYLFMHPENYDYDGNVMPEHMKATIKKNVEAYKNRVKVDKIPKTQDDPVYKMQEIYGENINNSLNKIKDWHTYFPDICSREIKKARYYMFTLGGRKIMDMARLEDVFSQIIRDPRFRFDTVANLAFTKDMITVKNLTEPATPHSVLLSKYKRIIYPGELLYDSLSSGYNSLINFETLTSNVSGSSSCFVHDTEPRITKVMCNIVIRSNYRFQFACQKGANPHFPALESTEHNGEYLLKIDQYVCKTSLNLSDKFLIVNDEPIPEKPIWFYSSCAMICFGEDMRHMFSNIAFRFNPTDKNSPWVTTNHTVKTSTIINGIEQHIVPIEGTGLRFLTETEIKLVSGVETKSSELKSTKDEHDDGSAEKISNQSQTREQNQEDEDYDIALAAKYLASSAEETGLDLSRMHGIC